MNEAIYFLESLESTCIKHSLVIKRAPTDRKKKKVQTYKIYIVLSSQGQWLMKI